MLCDCVSIKNGDGNGTRVIRSFGRNVDYRTGIDSKADWILSNRINERWLLLLLRFVPNLWKMTKFVLNAESGISGSETRHDDEQNLILTIEVANNLILSLIGPDICDQSFDMKRPTRRFFRYRRYNSISKRINHFVPSTFGAS